MPSPTDRPDPPDGPPPTAPFAPPSRRPPPPTSAALPPVPATPTRPTQTRTHRQPLPTGPRLILWTAALTPLPLACLLWQTHGTGILAAATAGLTATAALVTVAALMLALTRTLPEPWRSWRWPVFAIAALVALTCTAIGAIRLATDWVPAAFECGVTLLFSEGGIHCG